MSYYINTADSCDAIFMFKITMHDALLYYTVLTLKKTVHSSNAILSSYHYIDRDSDDRLLSR